MNETEILSENNSLNYCIHHIEEFINEIQTPKNFFLDERQQELLNMIYAQLSALPQLGDFSQLNKEYNRSKSGQYRVDTPMNSGNLTERSTPSFQSSMPSILNYSTVEFDQHEFLTAIHNFVTVSKERVEEFEKLKLATFNSELSPGSLDSLVHYFSEILFGTTETLLIQRIGGSIEVFGKRINKQVGK